FLLRDIADRLAQSFGGSQEDAFVQARVVGLKRRSASWPLSQRPRRGFLALREALEAVIAERDPLTEAELVIRIAAEVKTASPSDRVVRNLAAALRRQ